MAAIDYPSTLPGPNQVTSRPKVRARNSGLPGSQGYTAPERDYYGTLDVSWFLTRDQAAIFKSWWEATTGYSFNAVWPRLSQSLSVYKILGTPTFNHVYDGCYRVSAKVELRGASLAQNLPDTDPLFAYVPLLLHANDFTDSSAVPKTVVPLNGADISTTDPLFGTGSLNFGGTKSLEIAHSTAWDLLAQNFCLEGAVFITADSGSGLNGGLWGCGNAASDQSFITYLQPGTRQITSTFWLQGGGTTQIAETVPSLILNQWNRVAVCRDGAALRLLVNGAVTFTTAFPSADRQVLVSTRPLDIGNIYSGEFFGNGFLQGKLDEVRFTVGGAARYTGPYTVAAGEFPNRGPFR